MMMMMMMMIMRSLISVKWQRVTWVRGFLESDALTNESRVFGVTRTDALYFEGLVGLLG